MKNIRTLFQIYEHVVVSDYQLANLMETLETFMIIIYRYI